MLIDRFTQFIQWRQT